MSNNLKEIKAKIKLKIADIVEDLIDNASDDINDDYMQYYTLSELDGYELVLSAYWKRIYNRTEKCLDVHFEFVVDDEIEDEYWLTFHTEEQLKRIILLEYMQYKDKELWRYEN